MSLINDVLRDLDRRRGLAGHGLPAGVRAGGGGRYGGSARAWIIAGTALLLLAGLAAAWHLTSDRGQAGWSAVVSTGVAQRSVVPEPAPERTTVPVVEANPSPVLLTGMTLSESGLRHRLEFALDRTVAHRMEEDGRVLYLHMPGVRLDTELPDLVGPVPGLVHVDVRQRDEGLELILRFDASFQAQAVMNGGAGGGVLRLDLIHPAVEVAVAPEPAADAGTRAAIEPAPAAVEETPTPTVPVPSADIAAQDGGRDGRLVRSPVQDPGEPRARRLYRQAVGELDDGRRRDAIALLEQALAADAGLHPARDLLASVLVAQGRVREAMEVLERGLAHSPEHMPFATRLARLHMRQGDPEAAITVLEESLPARVGNGSQHALLAGLYQQTGRSEEAVGMYRDLVRAHPGQSVWWLGLGLSLEDADQPDRAAAAYRRARDTGGLEAELAVFVTNRIDQLRN